MKASPINALPQRSTKSSGPSGLAGTTDYVTGGGRNGKVIQTHQKEINKRASLNNAISRVEFETARPGKPAKRHKVTASGPISRIGQGLKGKPVR